MNDPRMAVSAAWLLALSGCGSSSGSHDASASAAGKASMDGGGSAGAKSEPDGGTSPNHGGTSPSHGGSSADQGAPYLAYDDSHHVLYSSNWAGGAWRLVTP